MGYHTERCGISHVQDGTFEGINEVGVLSPDCPYSGPTRAAVLVGYLFNSSFDIKKTAQL